MFPIKITPDLIGRRITAYGQRTTIIEIKERVVKISPEIITPIYKVKRDELCRFEIDSVEYADVEIQQILTN
jgi:hypothetical protein